MLLLLYYANAKVPKKSRNLLESGTERLRVAIHNVLEPNTMSLGLLLQYFTHCRSRLAHPNTVSVIVRPPFLASLRTPFQSARLPHLACEKC